MRAFSPKLEGTLYVDEMQVDVKKYRLIDLAKGKLRVEDKCQALRLAVQCDDMLMSVRSVYEMAGR